jgi:hypothetical protein
VCLCLFLVVVFVVNVAFVDSADPLLLLLPFSHRCCLVAAAATALLFCSWLLLLLLQLLLLCFVGAATVLLPLFFSVTLALWIKSVSFLLQIFACLGCFSCRNGSYQKQSAINSRSGQFSATAALSVYESKAAMAVDRFAAAAAATPTFL